MKYKWFAPWGWIYRPVSWQGVVLVVLVIVFCAQVFLAVDQRAHSVSDTLYGIFPYVIPSLMLLNWIASKTSANRPT
jgi:F0F1-type ATP synthase assembly protein I